MRRDWMMLVVNSRPLSAQIPFGKPMVGHSCKDWHETPLPCFGGSGKMNGNLEALSTMGRKDSFLASDSRPRLIRPVSRTPQDWIAPSGSMLVFWLPGIFRLLHPHENTCVYKSRTMGGGIGIVHELRPTMRQHLGANVHCASAK